LRNPLKSDQGRESVLPGFDFFVFIGAKLFQIIIIKVDMDKIRHYKNRVIRAMNLSSLAIEIFYA